MSAKVTYQGEEDGPEEVTLHGTRFPVGKAVEVSDDTAIRLMGNPFFERDDGALAAKVDDAETEATIAEKVVADNAAAVDGAKSKPAKA